MLKKVFLFLTLLIVVFRCAAQDSSDVAKLEYVLSLVSRNYMDTINSRRLIEETIKSVFDRLDPHTVYLPAQDVKRDKLCEAASLRGTGMDFRLFEDTVTVVSVEKKSPADKSGVKPGMKIYSVNRRQVTGRGLQYHEVRDFILQQSENADSIKFGVIKESGRQKTVSVSIGDFPNNSIDALYFPNDSTVYIRLGIFTSETGSEFTDAVAKISKRQRSNVILDLRDNQGGMLKSCIEVCDHFFKSDIYLVMTEGRNGETKSNFGTGRGLLTESRLFVLINEYSASSSEVISAAVQDNDRGTIIGRRSFGKGLVQQIYNLDDGSQVRITSSKIVAPSGRSIQKAYQSGCFDKYAGEIASRRLTGENTDSSKIALPKNAAAFRTKKGRTVYSASGVIPDCFVPEDTATLPKLWLSCRASKTLDNFVLDDINKHRQEYGIGFKSFQNGFTADGLFDKFCAYALKDTAVSAAKYVREFRKCVSEQKHACEVMTLQLKSRYAFYLFGRNQARMILNEKDRDFLKAMEIINRRSP